LELLSPQLIATTGHLVGQCGLSALRRETFKAVSLESRIALWEQLLDAGKGSCQAMRCEDKPAQIATSAPDRVLFSNIATIQHAADCVHSNIRRTKGSWPDFLSHLQEFSLATGKRAFRSYIHYMVTRMSIKEHPIREVKAMAEFDYEASAELFPSRGRMRQRQSFGYKRFDKAAQALRFAMEDMPRTCLMGAFLEVNERRYGSDEIRRLYESSDYPLMRRDTDDR
jgi:hypothetical protein